MPLCVIDLQACLLKKVAIATKIQYIVFLRKRFMKIALLILVDHNFLKDALRCFNPLFIIFCIFAKTYTIKTEKVP